MADEMEVIESSATEVTYRGERLELKPLTVGAVPQIVRLARPVINKVLDLDGIPDSESAAMVDLALDMVDQHGESLFKAVGLAVGRDAEWVQGGDVAEFTALVISLVEVNRDFFDRRLKPLLAAQAKARAERSGAGPTASSSSSSAATH